MIVAALGYFPKELPKLARAAHLYAQATGSNEMDAMHAVASVSESVMATTLWPPSGFWILAAAMALASFALDLCYANFTKALKVSLYP